MASAMSFSSLTMPNESVEVACMKINTSKPIYWQGQAHALDGRYYSYRKITVYQTESMCNSFYAIYVDERGNEIELIVRENSAKQGSSKSYKYFVTMSDTNWYFNMD